MKVSKYYKLLKAKVTKGLQFKDLETRDNIYLYAGDVPDMVEYEKFVGLSLSQSNGNHIKHDITRKYPLPDNCVNIYQSEDVFEHIAIEKLPDIINEIYRVLKPGGIFRLSIPDYRCNLLHERTLKNELGELQFDPRGGGNLKMAKL